MAQHGAVELAADESANASRFDLKNLARLPARNVAISSLVSGLYLRQGGTNAVHVQLLLGAAAAAELPPILVQQDGWRVIDGLHRLEAAKLRGDETIRACFLDCTDEEALVVAIKSNTAHGLPLSRADRVSGARRVLDAHFDWSDRVIAGITGLSANTIASLRNQSDDASRQDGKRLGRDGRRRPITVGEGRHRVAEYISAHPGASLRQIARETDVSLGTVHAVSARIRRGTDQEWNGRGVSQSRPPARPAVQAGEIAEAATVNSTPPRQRKYADASPSWAEISAKMANDPAIRYTEGGKEFFRWMALHAAHSDRWRELAGTIPVHWLSVIASLADSLSAEWSSFAELLRNRQEPAS